MELAQDVAMLVGHHALGGLACADFLSINNDGNVQLFAAELG